MPEKDYPLHDINKVFDIFEETVRQGGVADSCADEISFINKLFASLPPQASEYAMMMLHGTPGSQLPKEAKEIMPLYIRFIGLADYLEKVDFLREIPTDATTEDIMRRHKIMDSLEEYEKAFGKELLGYQYNSRTNEAEKAPEKTSGEAAAKEEGATGLHLMNNCAPVLQCPDPVRTAMFYEDNLGFHAEHLYDERMPHIRLRRDNTVIALIESPVRFIHPVTYEFIIYASEPMLLYHELLSKGVKIIEALPDVEQIGNASYNRQFVFEDCDGRRICVSQSTEII